MITILNINLIAGRTGAAKLCKTIAEGLPLDKYNHHTLVGYDFGNDLHTTSVYVTSNTWRYKNIIYKGAVGLNFLFDWMTPGCITMDFLYNFEPYKQADIIHLHSIQGGYFDWHFLPQISKEKKVIMTVHDDRILSGNDPQSLFPYKKHSSYVERKVVLLQTDITYIGVSEWITNKVKTDSIIANNKAYTIHNGINVDIFSPLDKRIVRKKLSLPLDKKIILSIAGSGNKSNAKGLTYVQEIAARYQDQSDYLFITIGNHITKKTADNFRELAWIDDSTIMADYYAASDCFLYPTLADSFGLVVAESLSCSCPVLTFNVGGVPELVQHKSNGYLATYKDSNDLMQGFEWIMNHKDELSVSLDPKFSQETMIDQYEKLYKSLI